MVEIIWIVVGVLCIGICVVLIIGARDSALRFKELLSLPIGVEFFVTNRLVPGVDKCIVQRNYSQLFCQNRFLVLDKGVLETGDVFEIYNSVKGRKMRKIEDQAEEANPSDSVKQDFRGIPLSASPGDAFHSIDGGPYEPAPTNR